MIVWGAEEDGAGRVGKREEAAGGERLTKGWKRKERRWEERCRLKRRRKR